MSEGGLSVDCEIEKVNLKPFNASTIEMKKEGTDKLRVKLSLDREPKADWQEFFGQQVKAHVAPLQSLRTPKPPKGMIAVPAQVTQFYPITLEKGEIIIITPSNPQTVHDNIQLAMQLVNNTNEQVENLNRVTRQKIQAKEMQDKKEKEDIDQIRNYLKKNPPHT